MCNFKSALVVQDEAVKDGFRLLFSPWTESHSDLCKIFRLPQADKTLRVAKIEFSPPSMDTAHQVETYIFRLDKERTPEWFTPKIKGRL